RGANSPLMGHGESRHRADRQRMARRPRTWVLALVALGLVVGLGQDHSPRAAVDDCRPRLACTDPTKPADLTATTVDTTQIALSWSPSDASRASISGYRVNVDGDRAGFVTTTQYAVTGLRCGTTHAFTVVAVDSRGRRSAAARTSGSTAPCPAPP